MFKGDVWSLGLQFMMRFAHSLHVENQGRKIPPPFGSLSVSSLDCVSTISSRIVSFSDLISSGSFWSIASRVNTVLIMSTSEPEDLVATNVVVVPVTVDQHE